jgi:hypothetical protein
MRLGAPGFDCCYVPVQGPEAAGQQHPSVAMTKDLPDKIRDDDELRSRLQRVVTEVFL